MKKFLKLMLIGVGITFILSGCGSDSIPVGDTSNTLTVKSVELK